MKSKQVEMLSRLAGQQIRNLATPPEAPEAPATSATTAPVPKPKSTPKPKAEVSAPVPAPETSGAGGEPPIEPPIDHDAREDVDVQSQADAVDEVEAENPPNLFDMAVCQEMDDFEELVLGEVLQKLRQYRPLLAALGLDNPDGIKDKLTEINLALGDPLSKVKGIAIPIFDQVTEMMGEPEEEEPPLQPTMSLEDVEAAIESGNWSIFPLLEKGTDVSGHLFTIAGTACGWLIKRPDIPGVPWNNRQIWRTRNGLVMH